MRIIAASVHFSLRLRIIKVVPSVFFLSIISRGKVIEVKSLSIKYWFQSIVSFVAKSTAWVCVMIVSCSPNLLRGEKRNVSICGRPENDWLLWLSKRYDEVGESDLEKRNVYIALHWAYILASFERRSNEMLYIEGGIGEISGLFIGYSPWTFPDRSHIQR